MKRKGSIQPILILATILLIGVIVFALFKFDVLEKETDIVETPPVNDLVEEDVDLEDEDTIDDVELEEDDYPYDIEFGKLAPDFTLKNLEGEEVSLSDYRGKIVFLNFWATWCGWCDKEMPDLQKLYEENDDLVVLAVDVMEDKKIVDKYIEEGGYDFEVVLDEEGKVTMTYLAGNLPTTYFIDKEGILLGGKPGMMTGPEMNGFLETIRKGE